MRKSRTATSLPASTAASASAAEPGHHDLALDLADAVGFAGALEVDVRA